MSANAGCMSVTEGGAGAAGAAQPDAAPTRAATARAAMTANDVRFLPEGRADRTALIRIPLLVTSPPDEQLLGLKRGPGPKTHGCAECFCELGLNTRCHRAGLANRRQPASIRRTSSLRTFPEA